MLDLPLFTKYLDNTQNVDPLGTAPVNEALYRSVFPGINNAVRFIRIYSAICWMVRQIDQNAAQSSNPDIAALSAAGLEKIQLLLTWYNVMQGVGALAGANRTFPADDEEVATLRFDALLGSAAARQLESNPDFIVGEGAHYLTAPQYRPSLVNGLRFLAASTTVANTYLLTEAGEALADAYEDAISDHPWRNWLADLESLTVTREEVLEMGDMLDLFNPSPGEAKAFLDQYYPEDGETAIGPHWKQRWAGLTLALRALDAEQGNVGATEEDIRFTMARGASRAGIPLNLYGIEEAQGWWANLQLRQYLRLALDTLFRYAQSWVGDAVNSGRPRDISDCAQALGQLLVKALPKEHSQSTGSLTAQLMALKGAHDSFYEASPFQPYLQMGGLLDRLLDVCNFSPRLDDAPMALREAYIALVFCALEARNLRTNNHVEQQYPNDRLSLTRLQSLLDEFQEASPAAFLEHVVRYYVLLLHFTVVQERTRDGRNRFVLMLGDKGLERVVTKDGLGSAGMLQDRLKHALLLLEQCGLVRGKDGGAYVLTPAGRRRLKAVEALDMFEAA